MAGQFQPGHTPWNTKPEGTPEGCRRWEGHDTDYVTTRSDGSVFRRCHECLKAANRKASRIRHYVARKSVLEHYGTSCACCGEKQEEFLCIDHIEGGGGDHRRELASNSRSANGGSYKTYKWLIDSGFPTGFQTLCHNCNFAKHAYGVCPHQESR